MRGVIVSLVSVIVVCMMVVPVGVSARSLSIEVEDRVGDVGPMYTAETYDYVALYGDNSPIVEAGYLDMRWFLFSQKGNTYTFGMEMVGGLPQEGDPLPQGVSLLQYTLWLDPEAWDWSPYAFPSYFVIRFQYDGLSYHAGLYEYVVEEMGDLLAELPYAVNGPRFEVEFTTDSIGNLPTFWLFSSVVAYFGDCPWKTFVDSIDYGAGAPGQEWTSIPWPPPDL